MRNLLIIGHIKGFSHRDSHRALPANYVEIEMTNRLFCQYVLCNCLYDFFGEISPDFIIILFLQKERERYVTIFLIQPPNGRGSRENRNNIFRESVIRKREPQITQIIHRLTRKGIKQNNVFVKEFYIRASAK